MHSVENYVIVVDLLFCAGPDVIIVQVRSKKIERYLYMDAEHRHELHSNDMVKFIQNFPEYVKDNFMWVLGCCLIVAAIFTYGPVRGYFESRNLSADASATADLMKLDQSKGMAMQVLQSDPTVADTSLIVAANTLEVTANNAKTPDLSALASIKRAEAIRASLHYNGEDTEKQLVSGEIEKAKQAYKQAIAKASGNTVLAAKAEFGLGLCAEEVGDYDGAKEIYNKIIDNADYAATAFPRQAEARLSKFAEYQAKFVFVDAPVEVDTGASTDVIGSVEVVDPEGAKTEPGTE